VSIRSDFGQQRFACAIAGLVFLFCPSAAAQQAAGSGQQPAGQNGAAVEASTARADRHLVAVRAAGSIELNGVLDEIAWQTAPVARHFIQNDPREGAPATYDTEVRVVYDDHAIYFGVFAKDDEPGRIIVNDLRKDFTTDGSDGFRIILDTFRDERNGYQFATNPAGAKWDAQMANEGRENNINWDGVWDVATRISETGWHAEIRIPFRTLKFDPSEQQTWGLNFERKVRRLNEDSYWAPIPASTTSSGCRSQGPSTACAGSSQARTSGSSPTASPAPTRSEGATRRVISTPGST
jgi:hypothetical protein